LDYLRPFPVHHLQFIKSGNKKQIFKPTEMVLGGGSASYAGESPLPLLLENYEAGKLLEVEEFLGNVDFINA